MIVNNWKINKGFTSLKPNGGFWPMCDKLDIHHTHLQFVANKPKTGDMSDGLYFTKVFIMNELDHEAPLKDFIDSAEKYFRDFLAERGINDR